MPDLVIPGRRVVLQHAVEAASIHIRSEKINAIKSFDDIDQASEVVTASDESFETALQN